MDSIISIKNIDFAYSDENGESNKLFEGFSLDIERGSFTALLGHNGSGKSTLARMMNGMLLPDGGCVTVSETDTADEEHELDIRRTVGLVFQNPDNQIVSTIVAEDVAFGPENLGIKRDEIIKRVKDALSTVDMLEYENHATHKLSGGQKQRVAIAGILAMEPECIVLDEPTSMLDPRGRKEVLDVLLKLNREKNMTVVMITHYMEEAALADRVVVLDSGKIVADGDCRSVFSKRKTLIGAGLELPQPAELIYELRQKGYDLPETVLSADECADVLFKLLNKGK